MSETVFKVVHFKPFDGYEVLGEYSTEEEAEACAAELVKQEPEAVHAIARVPRATTRGDGAGEIEEGE